MKEHVTVDLDKLRERLARKQELTLDDIDLLFGLIESGQELLTQATARERTASEAYNGQQQSYRELEALYSTMTERAQQAEADAAALRAWIQWLRDDAAAYGPEPGGMTKGYVWAGAVLQEADQVLANHPAGARLLADHHRLEGDAAAFRRVLDVLSRAGDIKSVRSVATAMLERSDAGAALLAELKAARTLRAELCTPNLDDPALDAAIKAYDAVAGDPS